MLPVSLSECEQGDIVTNSSSSFVELKDHNNNKNETEDIERSAWALPNDISGQFNQV